MGLLEDEKPENVEEQFVQMFAGHERDLRAFVRSMGLDWSAVDDVMDPHLEVFNTPSPEVVHEAVEEKTGEKFTFVERLYSNVDFVADLQPAGR